MYQNTYRRRVLSLEPLSLSLMSSVSFPVAQSNALCHEAMGIYS